MKIYPMTQTKAYSQNEWAFVFSGLMPCLPARSLLTSVALAQEVGVGRYSAEGALFLRQ